MLVMQNDLATMTWPFGEAPGHEKTTPNGLQLRGSYEARA
jgi:hypothetical protein